MYVIATVFCSNFHFSVSLHVPFSQFLFERDSYSNEYLLSLAKFGFDTAENELCKNSNFLTFLPPEFSLFRSNRVRIKVRQILGGGAREGRGRGCCRTRGGPGCAQGPP